MPTNRDGDPMRLVGNYLSPYVRRVAVSLNLLRMEFELEELYVFKQPDAVRARNPVVRIPVLELNDGDVLVESSAILDELDRLAGPDKALTPPTGLSRRNVMQTTAVALASVEKAQWAFYEGRVRPAEKVHAPWVAHNDDQVQGGFAHLNDRLCKLGENRWIADTSNISQADITAAVAFSFADAVRPRLKLVKAHPELSAFADRCESLEAFRRAPIPDQIS